MTRPRQKLRNGTWVVPGTGERSRRQFTLRYPAVLDGSGDDDAVRPVLSQATMGESVLALCHNIKVALYAFATWLNSPNGRGTLKCSVAYLLASMWTFFKPFARWLGPMDGKHIVATITVYFHPARTIGSQIEAVAIASVAVLYAMFIGTMSMVISVVVGSLWDQVQLSYALILLLFIGGGLGFIGWLKQKLNNPLVGVGASIASIGIITIVTKENSVHTGVFSNHKIIQSLKILLMALVTSTSVNLILWRVSARVALRNTMRKASTSLSEMLSTVAGGFLSGAEEDLGSKGLSDTVSSYNATMATMTKNLRESKFEYYILGREEIYKCDKALVRSMERIAQSLGGLRSAATTQYELLKETTNSTEASDMSSSTSQPMSPTAARLTGQLRSGTTFNVLSSIDEASEEHSENEEPPTPLNENPPGEPSAADQHPNPKTPAEIFELFIARLGPSLKSLVHTLAGVLREPPYGAPGSPVTVNEQFKHSVDDALRLFNSTRAKALEELYSILELDKSRPENIQADYEEVAAACGHFSFSLLGIGDEMQRYLIELDDLQHVTDLNRRTWNFLKFWKYINLRRQHRITDPEQETLIETVKPLRRSALPKGIPDKIKQQRDKLNWDATPQASQKLRGLSQRLLAFSRFMARDDIRFGLKVGIGAVLYGMLAFIPETRPIYQHWRGEWGLLSFMIVCSMTVGAANTTGFARFFGTLVGAACVIMNWYISGGHAVPLALLGWLVSFGTFYITIELGNAPMGRFILLSYNVSCLYAYSLSQQVDDDDDDEGGTNPLIQQIAFHRVVAVSLGILWGLVVCRLIWPISARRKFKEGLCVLYLQMGLVWKRGPLAILLRGDSMTHMRVGEQAAMQRYATQLQTLRKAASGEYELRGPFPHAAYGRILASTQRLLDAFHAMNLVTQKHGLLSEGERALLRHTARERAEICARICHVFQVLASSIMLEYPLTDAIPSVIGERDKLLGKIFRFRKEHTAGDEIEGGRDKDKDVGDGDGNGNGNGNGTGSGNGKSAMFGGSMGSLNNVTIEESDYALLYAFALVTGQVSKELKVVESEVEGLFGRMDEDALLLQ